MTTDLPPPSSSSTLFARLESHPYSTDYEYQTGLAAILGHAPLPRPQITSQPSSHAQPTHHHATTLSPNQPPIPYDLTRIPATDLNHDLHLRARCFYFARKHPDLVGPGGVDFDAYVTWRNQQPEERLHPLELTNPPAPPGSANVSANTTPEKRTDVSAGANERGQVNGTPTKRGHTPGREQSDDELGHERLGADESMTSYTTTDGTSEGPTASFQEVMELIKEGKPIPGIRDIPDTVLEGQGTAPTGSQRRKPWERGEQRAEGGAPAWQVGRAASLRDMFGRREEGVS